MAMTAAAATSCGLTKLVFLCPSPRSNVNSSHPMLPKSRFTASKVVSRFGSFKSGGAGVLEKPAFDQSQFDPFTQVLEGILFRFWVVELFMDVMLLLFSFSLMGRRRYWTCER